MTAPMRETPSNPDPAVSGRCFWHPDLETGLSCSRCGRSICPSCMVQAPVGIRCKECGRPIRMPTYDVGPLNYVRGLAVCIAIAIFGGVAWLFLNAFLGVLPFVSGLVGLGLGYATSELLGLAINRKRSILLAVCAGGAVVIAFLIPFIFGPPVYGLWELLIVFVGIALAVQRVRP